MITDTETEIIMDRLRRLETRLCRLMLHLGLDPSGEPAKPPLQPPMDHAPISEPLPNPAPFWDAFRIRRNA